MCQSILPKGKGRCKREVTTEGRKGKTEGRERGEEKEKYSQGEFMYQSSEIYFKKEKYFISINYSSLLFYERDKKAFLDTLKTNRNTYTFERIDQHIH